MRFLGYMGKNEERCNISTTDINALNYCSIRPFFLLFFLPPFLSKMLPFPLPLPSPLPPPSFLSHPYRPQAQTFFHLQVMERVRKLSVSAVLLLLMLLLPLH